MVVKANTEIIVIRFSQYNNRFPICRTIGRRQTGLRSYEDDRADA